MVMIEEISAGRLRAALDAGEVTSRDVVQASLDRIAALDRTGPALHAVIEVNPDALEIADALDAELAAGRSRGPLHGIPVLLKDNIATADRMQTTAGSLALVGAIPRRDAFVARRLRAAGAVILGKTNLSEWANFRGSPSVSGWSARGGQALNPYQLDRTPSGSSSGAAVAVAASYAPLAVGTETNGSIVSPSGTCGLVGIKPTVGLVSRAGIIPISRMQDTAGPMARTVAEAAALLSVLAGDDPDDPAHGAGDGTGVTYPARPAGTVAVDFAAGLDAGALRGARIGVLRSAAGFSDAADGVFEAALVALCDAGAELVDPVAMPPREDYCQRRDGLEAMLWDLAPDIAAYIDGYLDPAFPIRSLADIVAFNRAHAAEELTWFGQDILEMALEKSARSDPEYVAVRSRLQRWSRTEGIDALHAAHGLDALVAPTNAPAPKIDLVNGDHHIGGSSTAAAVAGYPIVTVPAGMYAGLPLGLSFIGTAFSEATLIRLAYAFEQATMARRAPGYLPAGVMPPAMVEQPSAAPVS